MLVPNRIAYNRIVDEMKSLGANRSVRSCPKSIYTFFIDPIGSIVGVYDEIGGLDITWVEATVNVDNLSRRIVTTL